MIGPVISKEKTSEECRRQTDDGQQTETPMAESAFTISSPMILKAQMSYQDKNVVRLIFQFWTYFHSNHVYLIFFNTFSCMFVFMYWFMFKNSMNDQMQNEYQ